MLAGFEAEDAQEDLEWCAKKICNMRIFPDEDGKMNRSLIDIGGEILLVSQFTLHASTRKGNRPSFIAAAPPEIASKLYEQSVTTFKEILTERRVKTGVFGAHMDIRFNNNGPVTIILDSKSKT